MSSSDEHLLQSLDDPDADIILRSCDHHEFRVLKLYLTKTSPVLRDLIQSASSSRIATARAASATTSSLPSVQLSDSSTIISSLLTFILPMVPVLPSTLEHTMILLSAAQKYQMDPILSRIRAIIGSLDPPLVFAEISFQVYSLARMYGLRQEALQAARMTLTFPFTVENLEDKLDVIPGIYLQELWKYRQSVRTHLTSDLVAFRTTGIPVLTNPTCYPATTYGTPAWLDAYVGSIADSPALFDITEFHMCLSRHITQRRCWCGNIFSNTLRAFWTDLTNVVHGCFKKAESIILPFGDPQNAPSPSCPQNVSPTSPLDSLDMSDANILIQSCDLVNFRVHQRTLAMSSPFFDDMFSLPQPQPSDGDVVDGLPVVRLSEDAEVLNSLTSMLYPIPSVLPNSYDKALKLLVASQKYDMVGVQSRIRAEIQNKISPALTGPETFRLYAISSKGKLPYEVEKFARLTLDFPMTFEYLCDELPSFEGRALRDLVGFRKRCRDNLVSCFESFHRLDQPFNIWTPCTTDGTNRNLFSSSFSTPSWITQLFKKHLDESREAFSKPFFDPRNIRGEYLSALQAHINSYSCISCTKVHTLNGETFCKALEDGLTKALSERCMIKPKLALSDYGQWIMVMMSLHQEWLSSIWVQNYWNVGLGGLETRTKATSPAGVDYSIASSRQLSCYVNLTSWTTYDIRRRGKQTTPCIRDSDHGRHSAVCRHELLCRGW